MDSLISRYDDCVVILKRTDFYSHVILDSTYWLQMY